MFFFERLVDSILYRGLRAFDQVVALIYSYLPIAILRRYRASKGRPTADVLKRVADKELGGRVAEAVVSLTRLTLVLDGHAESAVEAPSPHFSVEASMLILGLSSFKNDTAAALMRDGAIEAAIENAKLQPAVTRGIPDAAIQFCLGKGSASWNDLDVISGSQQSGSRMELVARSRVPGCRPLRRSPPPIKRAKNSAASHGNGLRCAHCASG